ncbi:MAG: T9SS type A sorting domain-containing protein [Saprospiraceae bacterium]|nr:T9SS type A sorting domain-containing protein [Saprospiraceae bacterium]MBP6567445.1 T9SS type A sorting domain-containing protein [Saprospiraceae bacterium]
MKFNVSFTQSWKTRMSIALVLCLGLFSKNQTLAQCNNVSQFGTINAPTNSTTTTITTCSFGGEYSTVNSAAAGSTYLFSATGGTGNYITIRQGTPGGTVLGFGFSPISVVCTVSGPLYLHYNINAACGTDGSCHTGVVQCTSCPGAADPCTAITPVACATPTTASLSGSGLWSPGSCGFSTPGTEKLYSFTPTITGVHFLQVTSTNSGGFIDYLFKAASDGCSSTGWTCLEDIFSPVTTTIGTLTAGITYYILLDPETASSVTQTFQINCATPPFDPCESITTLSCATPTTASLSGSGSWSPSSCGFSTPGKEKVYSFTPVITGTHFLQVTSATGGFIDYFIKATSGGCNSTGWNCIDDINISTSASMGTLTAGITYYILLDPETTSSVFQTFQINCAMPPCTAPGIPSASGVTHNSATLSWSSALGATSYRYSYGPPGHVCGTASLTTPSTSVNLTGLLSNTTYTFCVSTDACGGGAASNYVSTTFTTDPPCGIPLDAPWTLNNIGGSTGSGTDNEFCAGTIEISSSGFGSPSADKQTFAGQTLCGNSSITAKLESVTNLGWGGVMIRENTALGSKKVALRSQLSSIVIRDVRTTTNGVAQMQQIPRPSVPMWMRITRTGNVFTGYTSNNGAVWSFAFSVTIVLPECVEVGLFTQSTNNVTTTLATFSNITLTGGNNNVTDNLLDNRSKVSINDFSVYPNPASDEINVKWISGYTGKAATITVTNQLGQTVVTQKLSAVTNEIETINVSQLTNGMYILSVQSEDKQTIHRKFTIGTIRP